jgi:adenylosuccinate synthase
MPATIVIGAQWGDEGKGKIVDHLAERAQMVVRYQGGNNAGHTVVIGDTVLKLHQVPAGIIREGVAAVLGNGMVINPPALVEELDRIASNGIAIDNLFISDKAHVVMPYHLMLDGLEERLRGKGSLGTTKKGIGPAYADKYARRGLRMRDLVEPERFRSKLEATLAYVNRLLLDIFGEKPFSADEIMADYRPAIDRIAPWVTDTSLVINKSLARGESILLEGAQATMLDIDFGTYPFVTSSSPTSGGACQGAGMSPVHVKEVIGVVKAYTSRVGTGPFPTELHDEIGDFIVETGHEYGTTTGRRRRPGWLDAVGLRYAARINGFTGVALTRVDVLSGLDEVSICTGYRLPDGSITEHYPADTEVLAAVEPVYETHAGWDGDINSARAWDELPANLQRYCERVAELLGVGLDLVSVGAERSDLVPLRWPM